MIHIADNLLIAVIGGAGKSSAVIPTFGATQAVTRATKALLDILRSQSIL